MCPSRSGVQGRGGVVCGLRVSHRRPLPTARERALLARDLCQVRRVFERAHRDLLLQGPPALLQARLWEVRAHPHLKTQKLLWLLVIAPLTAWAPVEQHKPSAPHALEAQPGNSSTPMSPFTDRENDLNLKYYIIIQLKKFVVQSLIISDMHKISSSSANCGLTIRRK